MQRLKGRQLPLRPLPAAAPTLCAPPHQHQVLGDNVQRDGHRLAHDGCCATRQEGEGAGVGDGGLLRQVVPRPLVAGDVGHGGEQLQAADPEATVQSRHPLTGGDLDEGVESPLVQAGAPLNLEAGLDKHERVQQAADAQATGQGQWVVLPPVHHPQLDDPDLLHLQTHCSSLGGLCRVCYTALVHPACDQGAFRGSAHDAVQKSEDSENVSCFTFVLSRERIVNSDALLLVKVSGGSFPRPAVVSFDNDLGVSARPFHFTVTVTLY